MFLIWFSQVTQMVYDSLPRHMIKLPSKFHPTSKEAYMELKVGMKKMAYLLVFVAKPNLGSLKRSVILPDQDVQVCGIFGGLDCSFIY